uniref:hypothetical protein n=1 Tax=Clostridium sp. NkU-1 TaxID=1095009 RepID=UPI000AFD2C1F
MVGGQAVITTATDIHGSFAVDLFAKEQGLVITELKKGESDFLCHLKGRKRRVSL